MTHDAAREIRPASPDEVRFAGAPGGLKARAARTRLRVDPAAGTLAFTSDKKSAGTTLMRLPHRTEPADLPELHTLYIVVMYASVLIRLLVFADRHGQPIALSDPYEYRNFDALWPAGRLEQLTDYGIAVEPCPVPNPRRLNQRFPGAARHWYLTTFPYNVAVLGLPLLLALIVFVLLIGYGAIG